jgi:ABC-type glycerol-3-phosphate transport system substrate-binding protein
MQSAALVAGIVAAALLVAGCGGGDSSSSTSTISKAAFIKKADAVCERSNGRMGAAISNLLKEKNKRKPTKADYEEIVSDVLVPGLGKEIEEIRALGAPSGDEDTIDAIVKALEEGREVAEDNPQAVIDSSSEAIFGIASRLAKEYGLQFCGSR